MKEGQLCNSSLGQELPAALVWGELLGSAQSYVTVVAKLSPSTNEYLRRYRDGLANLLQVYFMSGAVLGGFISAFLGHGMSITAVCWILLCVCVVLCDQDESRCRRNVGPFLRSVFGRISPRVWSSPCRRMHFGTWYFG